MDFDFIDGWLVRPRWKRIEPRESQFDWSYIDNELSLASKLNKCITLMVLGGPHSPRWLYDKGAEFSPFGKDAPIPVLWDKVYLAQWKALMRSGASL